MITRVDYIVHPMKYNDLVSVSNIKKFKHENIIGVYFLINKKTVVYVGQSNNIIKRIYSHTDKTFTKVMYIECNKQDLTKLETHYIVAFNPEYNKTHDETIRINNHRLWVRRSKS